MNEPENPPDNRVVLTPEMMMERMREMDRRNAEIETRLNKMDYAELQLIACVPIVALVFVVLVAFVLLIKLLTMS